MLNLKVLTRDFGEIEAEQNNIIEFKHGLPGFEELKEFLLIPLSEDSPFMVIQSLDEVEVAFTVIEPGNFISDYNFEISDNVEEELEISSIEDVLVLNIITLQEKLKESTVNLSAPLVININKNLGRQVILDDKRYELKYKFFEELINEEEVSS